MPEGPGILTETRLRTPVSRSNPNTPLAAGIPGGETFSIALTPGDFQFLLNS